MDALQESGSGLPKDGDDGQPLSADHPRSTRSRRPSLVSNDSGWETEFATEDQMWREDFEDASQSRRRPVPARVAERSAVPSEDSLRLGGPNPTMPAVYAPTLGQSSRRDRASVSAPSSAGQLAGGFAGGTGRSRTSFGSFLTERSWHDILPSSPSRGHLDDVPSVPGSRSVTPDGMDLEGSDVSVSPDLRGERSRRLVAPKVLICCRFPLSIGGSKFDRRGTFGRVRRLGGETIPEVPLSLADTMLPSTEERPKPDFARGSHHATSRYDRVGGEGPSVCGWSGELLQAFRCGQGP